MLKLEPTVHRVAIAGRVVTASTGQPVFGALVELIELTNSPLPFQRLLHFKALQYGDRWPHTYNRPDRKLTATDGFFCFLDLPNGNYKLMASLPNSGIRYDRWIGRDRGSLLHSQPEAVEVPAQPSPNGFNFLELALPISATDAPNGSQSSSESNGS